MNKNLKEKLLFVAILIGLMIGSAAKAVYDIKNTLEFYKEDQSLDDLLKLIAQKMAENEFYSTFYSKSASGSNSTSFETAYYEPIANFLTHYYSYMSDEQIVTLLYFIEYEFPNYDYRENGIKDTWNDFLESLIFSDEVGYGLKKSMFWLSENYPADSYRERNHGASHEFLVLSSIVGYDSLVSAIFQNDVQQLVDVICKETSIDEESARRLIQLFDNYVDEYGKLSAKGLLPDYLDEMKLIISSMIESKCEHDIQFDHSLLGSILKNSSYLRENGLQFDIDPTEDSFSFELVLEDYGKTFVTLPLYYLDGSMDDSMLLDSAACRIIQKGYDDSSYRSSMSLLSYIVGWNHIQYLADFDGSINQKKQILYQSLRNYFSSEDEFNRFLVALDTDNTDAVSKYFSIWKGQMMDGSVTFRKLLEYNSLRDQIVSSRHLLDQNYYEEALVTEKGSEGSEVFEFEDYFFYSNYDYMTHFDEVLDYFHTQNSIYVELISQNGYFQRDWIRGKRDVEGDSDSVLSEQLSIQKKDLGNGHFIYYYVKPELFEEGEFVYAFTNVFNQRVSVPIQGISMMIENDQTKQMEDAIIVSMDEEPPAKEAYCKASYFSLCPKDKTYYYLSTFN